MLGNRLHNIIRFRNTLIIATFIFIAQIVRAQTPQDTTQQETPKRSFNEVVQLRGYVKNMQTTTIGLNTLYSDNLVHNRLNFRIYASDKITIGIENRNRIFWGETMRLNPDFGDGFNSDPGLIDLAFNIYNDSNIVMNSTFDRAWINYQTDKWELRAGRQRINWGINNFWNSNDIFNAYNFTDFDYEERPGSDAIKYQRYFKGGMSSLEIAVSPSRNNNNWTGGALYKFNKKGYDYQILTGWSKTDYVLGGGWAGSIKNAGFKGEFTYFHPSEKVDSFGTFSGSVSTEFMLKGKYFTTLGVLYNSSGFYNGNSINGNVFGSGLSAKNLMPTRYSFLASQAYPLSPLLNINAIVMYAPGVHLVLFMPSLSYSISQSWDVSLFAQSYFLDVGQFRNVGSSVFIRLKWSF